MSITKPEGRINKAETTHSVENNLEYWAEMKASLMGRNKLYQVSEVVSDTMDTVIEANPDVFPDQRMYPEDPRSDIWAYLAQGEKFHQFDILTHMTTSEEVFRNGKSLEVVKDQIDLDKLKAYYQGGLNGDITRFDGMLLTMRLHDVGKLFEARRPYDPSIPYAKQKTGPKKRLEGNPYQSEDHFDIGQEVVDDLEEKEALSADEARFVRETLQAHSVIQKSVYALWREEGHTIDSMADRLEEQFTPEQLLNGTVAVLSDEFAKGTPPDAAPDSNFYKDQAALEKLAPVLINRALERI